MSIKPFILYTKIIYNWFKKSAYLLINIAIRVVYCFKVYIINIFLWAFPCFRPDTFIKRQGECDERKSRKQ